MLGKGAKMPDLIFRDTDPDELRAAIVADVLAALRPILNRRPETDKRIATRAEMAQILGWPLAKLDRESAARRIPSLLSGGRRCFEIEKVLEAVRAQTADAERIAAERQAKKHANRKAGKTGISNDDHIATVRRGERYDRRRSNKKGTADAERITDDCQGEKQTKPSSEIGGEQ